MSAPEASPTPPLKTPPPLTPALLSSMGVNTSNEHSSQASTPTASSTSDSVREESRSVTSETSSFASSVSVLERVLALKNLPLHAPSNFPNGKPDPNVFRTAPARTVGSLNPDKMSLTSLRSMLAKRATIGPDAVPESTGEAKSPSKQFGTLKQVSTQVVVPDDFVVKYADDGKTDVTEEQRAKWKQHRKLVATEILETEKSYVGAMCRLVEQYVKPTENGASGIPEQIGMDIFKSIPNIVSLNSAFLSSLECAMSSWDSTERIADRFLEYFQLFRTYKDFAAMHELKTTPALEKLARSKAFQSYQDKIVQSGGDMLASYLIQPIQRLPRYKLLLESLIKLTPKDHPEAALLREALYKISNVALSVNEAMRDAQQGMQLMKLQTLFGRTDIVAAGRKLLIEAPVVITRHTAGGFRMPSDDKTKKDVKVKKDKEKWSGQKGMLYVFSDMVLLGVKTKDREREFEKQSANGNPYQLYAENLQHFCPVAQLAVHDIPSSKQDEHDLTILSPLRSLTISLSTDAMKAAVLRALREAEGFYRELTGRRGQQEVHTPASPLTGVLVPGCENCSAPFYDICVEQQFRPSTYQFVCSLCHNIICTQCAVVHHAQSESARGAESHGSFGLGAGCSGMMAVECSKCSPPGKANKKQPAISNHAPSSMQMQMNRPACAIIPLDALMSVKLRSVAQPTSTPSKLTNAFNEPPTPTATATATPTVTATPARSNSAPRPSISLSAIALTTPIKVLDIATDTANTKADASPALASTPTPYAPDAMAASSPLPTLDEDAPSSPSHSSVSKTDTTPETSNHRTAALSTDEAFHTPMLSATPRKGPPPLPKFLSVPAASPTHNVHTPDTPVEGSLTPSTSFSGLVTSLSSLHVSDGTSGESSIDATTASIAAAYAATEAAMVGRRSVLPPPLPANIIALARASSAGLASACSTPAAQPRALTHSTVSGDSSTEHANDDTHSGIPIVIDEAILDAGDLSCLPPPPNSTPPLHARKSVFDRTLSPLVPLEQVQSTLGSESSDEEQDKATTTAKNDEKSHSEDSRDKSTDNKHAEHKSVETESEKTTVTVTPPPTATTTAPPAVQHSFGSNGGKKVPPPPPPPPPKTA